MLDCFPLFSGNQHSSCGKQIEANEGKKGERIGHESTTLAPHDLAFFFHSSCSKSIKLHGESYEEPSLSLFKVFFNMI